MEWGRGTTVRSGRTSAIQRGPSPVAFWPEGATGGGEPGRRPRIFTFHVGQSAGAAGYFSRIQSAHFTIADLAFPTCSFAPAGSCSIWSVTITFQTVPRAKTAYFRGPSIVSSRLLARKARFPAKTPFPAKPLNGNIRIRRAVCTQHEMHCVREQKNRPVEMSIFQMG
jgi:hypothetical protein